MRCGDPHCATCVPRDELAPVVTTIRYPGVVVEMLGASPSNEAAPEAPKPTPARRFPAASITISARPRRLF